MTNLTEILIRSLRPPEKGQKTYWDALSGFGVRVSQGGTKTFVLMHGRNRQLTTIGRVGIIALADARAKAKNILAQKTLGQHQPKTITFGEAYTKYQELKLPYLKERTQYDYKRILDLHFLPKVRHERLRDIAPETIYAITDKLAKTPSEQSHALAVGRTFFKWCVRRRYLAHSPLEGVELPKLPSRKRVLSDEELPKVYRAAETYGYPYGHIVRLIMLTGQRPGEIAALREAWFSHNQQTIEFPAGALKHSRSHTIPLGPTSLQLLKDCPRMHGYFFPARGKTDRPFSGFSKSKAKLMELLPDVGPFTDHDLRRTFSTNIARLGVLPHIKEMLLGHASAKGEVEGIYDLYQYLPEMRVAVEKYDTFIASLLQKGKMLPPEG
ncbi:MAG TPA: tyrosine-type recombinase/integrase [Vineibacter sp.]|nr:tyrosine-type recombinase/integrase [Vineibacter sp.]